MNMEKKRILVVDDEPQIHRFLRPALEASGYDVAAAHDAAGFLRLAATAVPDAVLLDLGLPDMDGREALVRLRAFSTVPVIVLSARNREAEKIAALDEGADDYVEKPFGLGELLARLRTALRHRAGTAGPGSGPDAVLQAGPVTLDAAARQVRVSGATVPLSPREYALLDALMRNPGRVLTHRQLLVSVWGPAHAQDVQYLRVYIGHLRQKLGAEAAAMIATEPAIGYRLTVPESGTAEIRLVGTQPA
jgi:two-component system KDP operon response regulator KdpE